MNRSFKITSSNKALLGLTVEKICSHEEFESNFWLDWELRDLGGAVGVPYLVGEVHAHLL